MKPKRQRVRVWRGKGKQEFYRQELNGFVEYWCALCRMWHSGTILSNVRELHGPERAGVLRLGKRGGK